MSKKTSWEKERLENTNLQIGLIPLARTTFDIDLANDILEHTRIELDAAGFTLHGPDTLITNVNELRQSIEPLLSADLDLIVILQTTFADSTMLNLLADNFDIPFLLWSVPEPPTGERLRLNSFCGINLAAHSLTLRGHPYSYIYADPQDDQVIPKIKTFSAAARAYSRLGKATLGVLGDHPPGMDSCHLDAKLLQERLGIRIHRLELESIFKNVRNRPTSELDPLYTELDGSLENLGTFDREKIYGTLSVFKSLEQLAEQHHLDGLAVRCWPEFFTDLGCAACGALSMLSNRQIPCSCEADANGTITQLILGWLSGEPAFGTDIVYFNREEDSIVLWHCGLAPLSMADPTFDPRAALHSNRQVPLVMEFPLKPGRVTLARLSRAAGSLSLVVAGGEMLSAPLSFAGTSGVLRTDRPAEEVLDQLMLHGLEHHISLTYGDHQSALIMLAEWLNIPIIRLT
jgi:L-fucose isomerase-like protein